MGCVVLNVFQVNKKILEMLLQFLLFLLYSRAMSKYLFKVNNIDNSRITTPNLLRQQICRFKVFDVNEENIWYIFLVSIGVTLISLHIIDDYQ